MTGYGNVNVKRPLFIIVVFSLLMVGCVTDDKYKDLPIKPGPLALVEIDNERH